MIDTETVVQDNYLHSNKRSNDILTPDKLLWNLDFLNSPAKDMIPELFQMQDNYSGGYEIFTQESDSDYFNIDSNSERVDFEEVFDFQSSFKAPSSHSFFRVQTDPTVSMKGSMKSSLKSAKPFFPKRKATSMKIVNDENWNDLQNNSEAYSINAKCTSMNKFTCRFDIQIPNEGGFKGNLNFSVYPSDQYF